MEDCGAIVHETACPWIRRKRRIPSLGSRYTVSIAVLVVLLGNLAVQSCGAVGIFPAQVGVGTGKPVATNGSCGSQDFCSHSSSSWLSAPCAARQCNASCPHDASVPSGVDLSLRMPGYVQFGNAFTHQGDFILLSGYMRLNSQYAPVLDGTRGFTVQITISSFLSDAPAILFEKVSTASGLSFVKVTLNFVANFPSGSISVEYVVNGTARTSTMSNVANLQTLVEAQAAEVTVSSLGRQLSVFSGGELVAATLLDATIQDEAGDFYIGGRALPGSAIVIRRAVKFFASAISERTAAILSGRTPATYQPSSQCHCPPSHPEVSSTNTSVCNNQYLPAIGSVLRINAQSYVVSNVNDGRLATAVVTALAQSVVHITIDLQGAFEIFHGSMSFWNPRARAGVLQLSRDGVQYQDLQYFAESCSSSFATVSVTRRANASQVNCKSSGLPGQFTWDYYLDRETVSQPLTDFGSYNTMPVPFATGRYIRLLLTELGSAGIGALDQYYGVTEIDIRGRCSCSGHSDTCVQSTSDNLYRCQCQYNTEGDMCERCQAGYNDKPWKAGNSTSPNACVQCNCHGHATACTYNGTVDTDPESRVQGGGGVCECGDNTAGRQCDQCAHSYYRDASTPLTDSNACLPCNCVLAGVADDGDCAKTGLLTAQCNCKPHVTGLRCDRCSLTAFLNTTSGDCQNCQCNAAGSRNLSCSSAGLCSCMPGFEGDRCDLCTATLALPSCNTCQPQYFNLSSASSTPVCSPCQCSATSSLDNNCDVSSGQCSCRAGFVARDCAQCDPLAATKGPQCDVCIDTYHSFNGSHCAPCGCHAPGSLSAVCNTTSGQCSCRSSRFTGRDCSVCHPSLGTEGTQCTTCQDGFHSFNGSHCEPCNCDMRGSASTTCVSNGTCLCKANAAGMKCDQCRPGTLGISAANPSGCAEVPTPVITSSSSTSLSVAWSAPLSGLITSYSVFQHQGSAAPIQVATELSPGSVWVRGLTPYTNYTFYVRACTAVECAASNMATQRTRAGIPLAQSAPRTLVRNGTTTIGWSPPSTTGGGPLQYTLRATSVDFSDPPQRLVPGATFEGLGFLQINAVVFTGPHAAITMSFRTLLQSTLLFFAADQFVAGKTALQIVNGQLQFLFDFGNGAVTVVAPSTQVNVSDGQLHTVTASRIGLSGAVSVDNMFNGTALSTAAPGSALPMATQVYLGGVPTHVAGILPSLTPFLTSPFVGCLSGLHLQGAPVDMDASAVKRERVLSTAYGCPAQISRAIHLLGTQGGYVSDNDNPLLHSGGTTFNIELSFRTLRKDGLLLYSGTVTAGQVSDFFALQIISEEVRFAFENGGGVNTVTTSLKAASINVCDGRWHTVSVLKSARVANVSVDKGPYFSVVSSDTRQSTDVTGAVYLGGYPNTLLVPSVVSSVRYFSGCLQSVSINSVLYTPDMAQFARLTGCPHSTLAVQCLSYNAPLATSSPAAIYSGSDVQQTFSLTSLRPASEYSVQVSVSSETGSTTSPWTAVRASDGAPENLVAPSITYSTGPTAIVTWSPPALENGLLLGYRLVVTQVATFQSSNAVLLSPSTSTITVSGQTLSYLLDNLLASRAQSVRLECFTAGGSVSTSGVSFTTDEAAPLGVSSPTSTSDRRSIAFTWQEPDDPSGQLTMYSLIVNASTVFTSTNTSVDSYTVSALSPATTYQATVEACTAAGCTVSSPTLTRTLEDAPEGLAAPQLTAESEVSIAVVWQVPSQPNGVITSYDVLLNDSKIAAVDGNATLRYVIGGLRPDTVYSVRVRAYTLPGSVLSPPQFTATLEHVPTGIAAPLLNVTSATSAQLQWTPPGTPNGDIVQYDVERDGIRQLLNLSSDVLEFVDTGLQPFTFYVFAVVACTMRGCSTGNESRVQTFEAAPQGVQPALLQTLNSTAIQATWPSPTSPNGVVTFAVYLYGAQLVAGVPTLRSILSATTATSPLVINSLLPFQNYSCVVAASTAAGSSNSSSSNTVRTGEAAPQGAATPSVDAINSTYLLISWMKPLLANGVITGYQLSVVRANTADIPLLLTFPGNVQSATVDGLIPFTAYQLRLSALNSQGRADSTAITQITAEDAPSGVPRPVITNVTSSSFIISWSSPSSPNGNILRYAVVLMGPGGLQSLTVAAAARQVVVSDGSSVTLEPAVTYGVFLDACTIAGCGRSGDVVVTIMEAAPEGVEAPTVTFANSSSLEFTWKVPTTPNGVITGYTVGVRVSSSAQLITSLSFAGAVADRRGLVTVGLVPATSYTLQLAASTAAGTTLSSLVTAVTTDGTPTGISAPLLVAVDSSTINVTWAVPSNPNGLIRNYTLLRDSKQVFVSANPGFYADTGLEPFTEYSYAVVVCSVYACGTSADSKETTGEAAPSGLAPPVVMAINSSYVTITWTEPNVTNGLIQSYRLLRFTATGCCLDADLSSCQLASVLQSCLASQTVVVASSLLLSAVDSDMNLQPYTVYAYQVFASTNGGITSSSLAIVLTQQAAPHGVRVPSVARVAARFITIQWLAPTAANGIITKYDVLRNSSVVTSSASTGDFNDTGLLPATTYAYSVSVCTAAGCSSSQTTLVVTLESAPAAVLPPSLMATSATNVSVRWLSPAQPNGVISGYEIYVDNLTTPTAIARPPQTSAIVSGLEAFTSYSIYLAACTTAGCTRSVAAKVTTLEAPPAKFSAPILMVLTSRSIDVMWVAPVNRNGIILDYTVLRNNTLVTVVNTTQVTDTALVPHTVYEYEIIARNSAGSVLSPATVTRTEQDTPEGIVPPSVTTLNSSSFSINLPPPSQPNGVLVNYSIIVDDKQIVPLGLSQMTIVSGFLPFSMHRLRTRVCTRKGCGTSTATMATTGEALASGILAPNISVINSTAIAVAWQPATSENGVVTEYTVVRLTSANVNTTVHRQAASLSALVFVDSRLTPFTNYGYRIGVRNGAGVSYGAVAVEETDEAAPSAAGLVLTAVTPAKRSVSLQWSPPTMPNGVLTFYRVEQRSTVTGNVSALAAVPATAANLTFTVLGLLPYTSYAFRVVAVNDAGEAAGPWQGVRTLEDLPEGLNPLLVAGKAVDGQSLNLTWDEPSSPNGLITSYMVLGDLDVVEYRGSARFFTLRRLMAFTTYSVTLQACTTVGCSRGLLQNVQTAEIAPALQSAPAVQALSATSVQVQWSPPGRANGIILTYSITRKLSSAADSTAAEVLLVDAQNMSALQYVDATLLLPYTQYSYRVTSANSVAQVSSVFSNPVQTLPADPQGVPAPVVTTINYYSLALMWTAPSTPNGIISGYNVFRAGVSITTHMLSAATFVYTDSILLKPFTTYTYYIEACTVAAGCTAGPDSNGTTAPHQPASVTVPTLTALSSTSVLVAWRPPATPNGVITMYTVFSGTCMASLTGAASVNGTTLQTRVSGLLPFSCYYALLEACTVAGCTNTSTPVSVTTLEDAPQGLSAPIASVQSPDSIQLLIMAPSQANGALVSYEILRNGTSVSFVNITSSGKFRLATFNDSALMADTFYAYVVVMSTNGGSTTSPSVVVATNPPPPEGLNSPSVQASSSVSLLITWSEPNVTHAMINQYQVFVNGAERHLNDGSSSSVLVSGLVPFSLYAVYVSACTKFGCVTSGETSASTLEAPPVGLPAPTVTGVSARALNIQWVQPSRANGVILYFTVERRQLDALNLMPGATAVLTSSQYNESSYVDASVAPFSTYEYRILAFNSAGNVSSAWMRFTTSESQPENVLIPVLRELVATSASLFLPMPGRSNGVIVRYDLVVNGVAESTNYTSGVTVYSLADLVPGTLVLITSNVCTSAGCTVSAGSLNISTPETTPDGLDEPTAENVTTTSFAVVWMPPAMPNGRIVNYTVYVQTACPQPGALPTATCTVGSNTVTMVNGDTPFYQLLGLTTFTRYLVRVAAMNSAGTVTSNSTAILTSESTPELRPETEVSYVAAEGIIVLSWQDVFIFNTDRFQQYTVLENGIGIRTITENTTAQATVMEKSPGVVYTYVVRLTTGLGSVTSRPINASLPGEPITEEVKKTEFYEEAPFIAGMAIAGVVLIMILVCIAHRPSTTKETHSTFTDGPSRYSPNKEARPTTPNRRRRNKANNETDFWTDSVAAQPSADDNVGVRLVSKQLTSVPEQEWDAGFTTLGSKNDLSRTSSRASLVGAAPDQGNQPGRRPPGDVIAQANTFQEYEGSTLKDTHL